MVLFEVSDQLNDKGLVIDKVFSVITYETVVKVYSQTELVKRLADLCKVLEETQAEIDDVKAMLASDGALKLG